jgi:hypothetical protein
MASSVSHDLLHWSCAPKEFHVPAGDYYQRRRDPFVFWIPGMKQYGCVMTTWIKGRPKETCGAVSLATSFDLQQWKDHGAILDPGTIGEPECPQMFPFGGRWYLLASIYDRAVGRPVYWSSTSPLGPWKNEPDGMLDGKDLCAAQIAFDGETPILFGWIPLAPAKPGSQTWGGHLALPREVHVLPDGKLGTRLPAKLDKTFKRLPWQSEFGEWSRLVTDAGRLPSLREFHILHDSVVEERFRYDELLGIHVGFVRGFSFASPRRLAMQKSFGGCRSWLDLPDLGDIRLVPVLTDEEHSARRTALESALA